MTQKKNEFGHNSEENIMLTGPNPNFPKQQVSLNQIDSGDINDFDHNEFEWVRDFLLIRFLHFFQLYHGENTLIFNELMMTMSALF